MLFAFMITGVEISIANSVVFTHANKCSAMFPMFDYFDMSLVEPKHSDGSPITMAGLFEIPNSQSAQPGMSE